VIGVFRVARHDDPELRTLRHILADHRLQLLRRSVG
jgi:hypothetical protein